MTSRKVESKSTKPKKVRDLPIAENVNPNISALQFQIGSSQSK